MIKKKSMPNGYRMILLIAAIIILLGGSISIRQEYTREHNLTEQKTVYDYTWTPEVSYKVYLKSNILYEENFLEENQMYLSEFVDYIEVNFKEAFEGSDKVDITGDYLVQAQVRGYTTKDEEKQVVWSKNYPLEENKKINVTQEKYTLSKQYQLKFDEYNEFAKSVIEASKVSTDVELVIDITGKFSLDTPQEMTELPINSELSIPLNKGYFNITKTNAEPVSNQITESIVIPTEINQTPIILGIVLIITGIITIVLLCILTRRLNEEEKRQRQIRKIYNLHSSRLVIINQLNIESFATIYKTMSMEDLVKVADELEQPVVCLGTLEEISKADTFYVIANQTLYMYQVPESSKKDIPKKAEKNNGNKNKRVLFKRKKSKEVKIKSDIESENQEEQSSNKSAELLINTEQEIIGAEGENQELTEEQIQDNLKKYKEYFKGKE